MQSINTEIPSHTFQSQKELFWAGQVSGVYVTYTRFSLIVEQLWVKSRSLAPDEEAGGQDLV